MKSIKWKKPSQQLIELFDDVVPEDEGVDKRKMFGYPCAFKKGNRLDGIAPKVHVFAVVRERSKSIPRVRSI